MKLVLVLAAALIAVVSGSGPVLTAVRAGVQGLKHLSNIPNTLVGPAESQLKLVADLTKQHSKTLMVAMQPAVVPSGTHLRRFIPQPEAVKMPKSEPINFNLITHIATCYALTIFEAFAACPACSPSCGA